MEALRPAAYGLVMRRLALLCLALVCPSLLSAHPEWKEANCLGVIDENNQLTLTIKFDVPSFLVGQTSKDAPIKALDELMQTPGRLADSIEPGQRRLLDGLRLEVDGRDTPVLLVSFPTAETIAATSARQGEADRYPVMLNARLSAQLPAKATKLRVSFPASLGTVFVNLRKGMEYQVVMAATTGSPAELALSETPDASAGETVRTLFVDGFAHVLPDGWDHCLFMLAMFLGATSLGQALRRSLVFTLGHSVTLTAVAMGWLGQPGPWIEPFIAMTIGVSAWLAFRGQLQERSALILPAVFGLVHGLGFAAAVADNLANWSAGDIVLILVGFNLGVEAAQALVIGIAALALWTVQKARLPEAKIRRGLSLAVAQIGFGVFLWRLLGLG
jgi:hydrogenase/urease accessory protein HupE